MKHLMRAIFQTDYARDTLINSDSMEEKESKSTSSPEALIEKHEGKTTDFIPLNQCEAFITEESIISLLAFTFIYFMLLRAL